MGNNQQLVLKMLFENAQEKHRLECMFEAIREKLNQLQWWSAFGYNQDYNKRIIITYI